MSTENTAPESAGVEGFSSADVSDVQHMSYEQARAELVQTVSRLEAGGAGLEESLALWERGEALAARCQADATLRRIQRCHLSSLGAPFEFRCASALIRHRNRRLSPPAQNARYTATVVRR